MACAVVLLFTSLLLPVPTLSPPRPSTPHRTLLFCPAHHTSCMLRAHIMPSPLASPALPSSLRVNLVIYLIRHAHTSFSAPPPHTTMPLASHLPLSPSAAPLPRASPPLLPCRTYRHHLCRGHDVPLSPLGRQQAMDLHPTLIRIAQKSQLVLVSPLSRALETLCYALHLNTPTATTCHCNAPCTTTTIPDPPCCTAPQPSNSPNHPFNAPAKTSNSLHPCPHTHHGPTHARSSASQPATPTTLAAPALLPSLPPCRALPHSPLPHSPLPCPVRVCALHSEHVAGPGDMGRDNEILASDFPFPFLSFSHLPHHWWPHHQSHPPPTPLPSTRTPPAIPAAPPPAAPTSPAPIVVLAAAAAAAAVASGAVASSPLCTVLLPLAPTLAAAALPPATSAAWNAPSLHEPRGVCAVAFSMESMGVHMHEVSMHYPPRPHPLPCLPPAALRKRVGEFRRFLSTCPEATIAVIGHSTFFMVLTFLACFPQRPLTLLFTCMLSVPLAI
ncbi:unnamed protein product [Closterium sp. Naga37s-1]|nr:unnamed protein product [Closterium sp. Naga37s-1]